MTDAVIDALFHRYAVGGDGIYGEQVTQNQHMLQCARLATLDEAPPALIAAALLHDYGHFLEGAGEAAELRGVDAQHELLGAHALSAWFGPEVVQPIALHVAAKRYLCAVEPGYQDGLSRVSQLSLALQGGSMTPDLARAFEVLPWALDAVRLRRWDDLGKDPDAVTPGLEAHRSLLRGLVGGG